MRPTSILQLFLNLSLILLLCVTASSAEDQLTAEVKPLLLQGSDSNKLTPGLGYGLLYRGDFLGETQAGHFEPMFALKLEGTLTWDRELNNEALLSDAKFGFSLLAKEKIKATTLSLDPDEDRIEDHKIKTWGYFNLLANLRHEADQAFKEQNLAVGLEFGYFNIQDEGIWSFVPSVLLAYDLVTPLTSDLRSSLNLDKDSYSRLRLEASLKSSFGKQFPRSNLLHPLGLRLDYRYYYSSDLDNRLERIDYDQVSYFAGALTYTRDGSLGPVNRQTYFIKLADGRIPPTEEDDTTLTLGVILPF